MYRNLGKYPGWWDWTSFAIENPDMMDEVRRLTLTDMRALSRDGFDVRLYENAQSFFVAEALEYVDAWQKSTADNPVAICGPVGPTEQLPLVAEIINSLGIDVRDGIFFGMDEFVEDGRAVPYDHELSFARTDEEMCFLRIYNSLRPLRRIYPTEDIGLYTSVWYDPSITIELTQGGEGNTKHFAFNDPLEAKGYLVDRPPTIEEFGSLGTRIVNLHPATIIQDARHSNGGEEWRIPHCAVTVGVKEVLGRSKCISIWHPGHHDNAFGVRLSTYMIAHKIVDPRVPMSMLGLHDNVRFSFLAPCIGDAGTDMK